MKKVSRLFFRIYDFCFRMAKDKTPARIRRMESRSIHTANGIEVKIPTELLNSENEVEFLHSDDGSISLLIKNVIL